MRHWLQEEVLVHDWFQQRQLLFIGRLPVVCKNTPVSFESGPQKARVHDTFSCKRKQKDKGNEGRKV